MTTKLSKEEIKRLSVADRTSLHDQSWASIVRVAASSYLQKTIGSADEPKVGTLAKKISSLLNSGRRPLPTTLEGISDLLINAEKERAKGRSS